MRTTGIFTTHYYNIQGVECNKPLYLIPFGDIHLGSYMHDAWHWHRFLKWAKTKERAHFLGMGDYFDLASTSERKIVHDTNLHESTLDTFESFSMGQILKAAKEMEFMRGRIIGMIEGNHYFQFKDGTTSTQKLCGLLNCKYLGVASFIRLSVQRKSSSSRAALDILAHHGKGSGRLLGSGINTVQQMGEVGQADIYLMGDNHQKSLAYSDKLRLVGDGKGLHVRSRKQLFCRTGSFLKGYEDGKASYVTDKFLNPTNLGVVKIEITPRRIDEGRGKEGNRYDEFYLDIHASL